MSPPKTLRGWRQVGLSVFGSDVVSVPTPDNTPESVLVPQISGIIRSSAASLIPMKRLNPVFLVSLLLGLFGLVQAQSEVCRLTASWVQKNPFAASSRELVGTFPLEFEDHSLTKLLRHQESGIEILVGIELLPSASKEPPMIRLAIGFGGKPEDVFDAVDGAQAATRYDKNWRFLYVSKNVEREKRVYTFGFSCERSKSQKR